MFSRIVVGIDGTEGGADAMALARRLASTTTSLVAVSIVVVDSHPSRGANLDYDGDLREQAEARLRGVLQQQPGVEGETLVAHSVAAGLHAAVEHLDGDLIVVGSCRRGPVGRILAGDDTRGTLRDAPCPVAIAPRDYALADAPIATIGLGWNGGTEGGRALEVARAIAGDIGAQLHAVAVVHMPPWRATEGVTTDAAVATEVAATAERLAALDGVQATTLTGAVVDELARFAAEVDLLIVGSHQRGPLGRIAVGSTSEQLTRRCVRPLMVVPRSPQLTSIPA
ncbi:MAG: universal stress protein [Solirubrobacterales bacterium]|nr:universal stress protein [Solirubrobacterales bacterium]